MDAFRQRSRSSSRRPRLERRGPPSSFGTRRPWRLAPCLPTAPRFPPPTPRPPAVPDSRGAPAEAGPRCSRRRVWSKASWIWSSGSPPWRSASAICPSRARARGSLRRGSHWRKARGAPSRLGSRRSAWIHPPRIPRAGEGGPWGHAPEGASIRESRRGSGPSASSARDRSTARVSPPPWNSAARSRRAGARSASSSAGNPTPRTAPASCSISRWAAPRA